MIKIIKNIIHQKGIHMDCPFYGITKKYCLRFMRCEGIWMYLQGLNSAHPKLNTKIARYVMLRSMINKLHDLSQDLPQQSWLYPLKPLFKWIYLTLRYTFSDPLRINSLIISIENKIADFEQQSSKEYPLRFSKIDEYFKYTGYVYGCIFSYSAKYQGESLILQKIYFNLGFHIGSLIVCRDSIKDFVLDSRRNKFNPFRGYNSNQRKTLQNKFEKHYQQKVIYLVEKIKTYYLNLGLQLPVTDTNLLFHQDKLNISNNHNLNIIKSKVSPVLLSVLSMISSYVIINQSKDSCQKNSLNNSQRLPISPPTMMISPSMGYGSLSFLGLMTLSIIIIYSRFRMRNNSTGAEGLSCLGECLDCGCSSCYHSSRNNEEEEEDKEKRMLHNSVDCCCSTSYCASGSNMNDCDCSDCDCDGCDCNI